VLHNVWVTNTSIAMGMTLAHAAGMGLLSPWPSVVRGKLPAWHDCSSLLFGVTAHTLSFSSLLSPLVCPPLAPSSASAFSLLLPSLLAVRTLSVIVIVLAVLVVHVFVSLDAVLVVTFTAVVVAVFVLGAAFAVVAFVLVVVGLMVMLVAGLTLSWVGLNNCVVKTCRSRSQTVWEIFSWLVAKIGSRQPRRAKTEVATDWDDSGRWRRVSENGGR
jgi:hypothetical protein